MAQIEYNFDDEYKIDTQIKFITLLIYDKTWTELSGLEVVKPDFFENRYLRNICIWIHDYYNKYKGVPSKLILTETATDFVNKHHLSSGEYFQYEEKIEQIFTLDDDTQLEYFKEKAVTFARQVAWKQALAKGSKVLEVGNYTDALEAFKEVLNVGAENDMGLDLDTLDPDDFLKNVNETYDKTNMLSTGLPTWDRALGGGFTKSNLHIIAAAPGYGKTKTMSYLARKALQDGKRIIFITLELDEQELMQGVCNSFTGMSLVDMRDPSLQPEFKKRFNSFINTFSGMMNIKFYRPDCITCNTIHNYIKTYCRWKSEQIGYEWKPDVIFLDYMDKILPIQKMKGNVYEDNGNVATDCKNLAITFECPVITGSQLGRTSWDLTGDQVISMSSVAESARKVHIAHSMTTINVNPAEKEVQKARLYLAKSRTGTPGTVVYVQRDLGRGKFEETERWNPKELETMSGYTIKTTNNGK